MGVVIIEWRVWAWSPRRLMWAVVDRADTQGEADELAEALQHRDPRRRVKVLPATTTVLRVKPPVHNPARSFRLERAAIMSDRADTNKRYKSPG